MDLEDNLMTIMAQLPKIDGREPQPHEVFDMIAGTSTGGCVLAARPADPIAHEHLSALLPSCLVV